MKKGIVICILLVMLVVSGCQGGLSFRRGGGREPVVGYRTGSQGIVLNFLPNYPRTTVYDDEPFIVLLEIRNRGSYDVGYSGDAVYLSGFDPGIITGISTYGEQIPAGFEGISQFNLEGGYDAIEFSGEIYPLSMKKIDSYPVTLLATACYGYRTVGSENICIDPNPFSTTTERRVCTPVSVNFGSQGAPIAITLVEVDATPRVTRFKIHISNVGGGSVFKPGADYLAKCNPYHTRGLEFNEVDNVRLNSVEVAGKAITSSCKPVDNEGHVRFINRQAILFCEIGGLGTGPAYATPLAIELDYGYRSTIARSVRIVQIP